MLFSSLCAFSALQPLKQWWWYTCSRVYFAIKGTSVFIFQRTFCGSSRWSWERNGVDMATLKNH